MKGEREGAENVEQTELIKGGLMDILCTYPEGKKWNELTSILAHTYREKRYTHIMYDEITTT